jgi:hypothetical protein
VGIGGLLVFVWVVVWVLNRADRRHVRNRAQQRVPHDEPPQFDDL